MKEKVKEEVKEVLVKVKFLGNFKEFINDEVYMLRPEEAAPYITLGYAIEIK